MRLVRRAFFGTTSERWVDIEESEEDEECDWEKEMMGENDEEAVRWIGREIAGEATRDLEQAWDDVFGKELDLKKVREGRQEEIECMRQRVIWSEVDGALGEDLEAAS